MLLTLALSSFLAHHWHKSNRLVLKLPPSRSPSTGASMSLAIYLQGRRSADLANDLNPFPGRFEERWIEISAEP